MYKKNNNLFAACLLTLLVQLKPETIFSESTGQQNNNETNNTETINIKKILNTSQKQSIQQKEAIKSIAEAQNGFKKVESMSIDQAIAIATKTSKEQKTNINTSPTKSTNIGRKNLAEKIATKAAIKINQQATNHQQAQARRKDGQEINESY
jgi:hypothetical protein